MKFSILPFLFPLLTAAQIPNLKNVTLAAVRYSGNGCPSGSVSATTSPDKTVITLGYDDFRLAIGPGFDRTAKVKSCSVQITFNLNYSEASAPRLAVVGAVYHGYANFGAGMNKTISSGYNFFQIDSLQPRTEVTIPGADSNGGRVFTEARAIAEEDQLRSPCGLSPVQLTVITRVSITSKFASAYYNEFEEDSIPLTHQINLKYVYYFPLLCL
ncbi:hypothetical protein QBC44DRAFT_393519 [Cladorrhinum sp. PSN332]|nr:hypothetical protein QBC44DRAFT_393519 [Cladorrhinum sp. PSN332]